MGKQRSPRSSRQLQVGVVAAAVVVAIAYWHVAIRAVRLRPAANPAAAFEATARRLDVEALADAPEPASPPPAAEAAADDERSDPRYACENSHDDCAVWAAAGECANNPVYMSSNCAHSCGTCETLALGCSPDGPNAVVPGDVSATFERLAAASEYSPRVLSTDPWVVVLDAFLTPAEAIELRTIGGHDFQRSLAGDGVTPVRTSSTSWCNVPVCEQTEIVKTVKARALGLLRMPEANSEHLQTLRYEPGQFYKTHHDQNAGIKSAWGPRVYTFFLYLSDVDEGGGTRFPRLNLTVTPAIGRALIWPSVRDDDVNMADMRTEHEALPVVAGEKYAANFWVHMREFQRPLALGCGNGPRSMDSGEDSAE